MKDLGLKRGKVELVEHKESWHQSFIDEAEILQHMLGIPLDSIQHVGSTSIPGILAKPILDIAIEVESPNNIDTWVQPLEKLGYWNKGPEPEMPQRRFFAKGPEGSRTIYLHVVASEEFARMITFRDKLRADAKLANEYSELKQKLAATYPENRERYTHLKNDFITRILND